MLYFAICISPLLAYLGSESPTISPTNFPTTSPSTYPSMKPSTVPSYNPSVSNSPTEVSYDFESREELITAVDLWRSDRLLAQQTYQNPQKWNVSIITNFDDIFSADRHIGWAHFDFTDLDVTNLQVS